MTSIVCRVCLDENVKMDCIQDPKLVEMYETLSNSKLNSEDGLPTMICYICVSQLQVCRRFFDMARESVRTLTHRIQSGLGVTSNNVTSENMGETHRPTVTTITHTTAKHDSVGDCLVIIKQEQVVKEEPVEYEDMLDIEESRLDVDAGSSQNIEQPLLKETSDENQYCCNVCNTKCISRSNLFRHMKSHTEEKPYACNRCHKLFNQADSLKLHMHKHTGETPYACDVCKKAFNRANHLKRHLLIHTGEKPYACEVCTKAFNQPGSLKLHMRIHTGEKPYACDICKKAFNDAGHLKRHMLIHIGEKPHVMQTRFQSS